MASGSEFKKVLVKDDRLNVTDSIEYAVEKGGQNMTSSTFNAITFSTSSHVFNIQIPSEQTLIDRRILWQSQVVLKIVATPPIGQYAIGYGSTDALSAFPLHQLTSVMTCTINNNSVSINMRDVLPAILRMNDIRELQRYNGYTPVAYDLLASYADGLGSNLNSLGGWQNAADNDLLPRGSWVLDAVGTADPGNNPVTPSALAVGTGAAQTFYVMFTVSEPLLVSPFLFAHPKSNNQGIYGVQNMNFVFNIGDATRVWRSATGFISSVSVQSFQLSRLIFNFLTPHPSDLMPARNVVPFYELPRYITSAGNIAAGATTTVKTNSLQLNQIPDKLIVFVRDQKSNSPATAWAATGIRPDYFLEIGSAVAGGVTINFNNMSGILASATQQDLYRYSVENGSNQSWLEYSGFANVPGPFGVGRSLPTTGSMLVLAFGKDIQLTEDFYAPGSLGNFNLQLNLTVTNQTALEVAAEVVIITVNSGCFVCERGTSSTYTGILTKADVLQASEQPAYHRSDVHRMVGGGFLDTLKSVVGRVLPILAPHAKNYLSKSSHPAGKAAAAALGALGYGASGGKKLADRMM